jgi:hypothetical protein
MGSGSLEKSYNPDNAAGLFSEEVSLINAVEWLLQAIFALQNSEGENKPYFENRYEKVKNMLIDLLPDVENFRAKPITKNQSKPSIDNHLTGIFKQTQFIVTAHSPLIVQSAPSDANIVLLKREGDQVIIHNDFNVIKGWRIDQVLTSDLFDLPTARPPEYDNYLKRQQ